MSWFVRRRPTADERLDAELRDHVERYVADLMARGVSEGTARRQARVELGGFDQAKEACRDVKPFNWAREFGRDLRLGLRRLQRDRLFGASIIIILALGVAATVAMFSVLHAIVLRPLPYAHAEQLARVTTHLMLQNRPDGTSMANFLDWRARSRSFSGMTFYRRTAVSLATFAGVDAPQRAQEGLVGPEFFELLGTPPLIGRTFSQSEFDRREPIVVLSERLWRDRFAADSAVLGRTLWIGGTDHTVIGVMPAAFQLPTPDTRFWRPLSVLPIWPDTRAVRDGDQFEVIARLKPGITFEEAAADLAAIAVRLRAEHPVNRNVDVRISPLVDHIIGSQTRRNIWLAFAAVLCLLMIACANVAGLLAARAARRRRELAVRCAIGAGRARLVRQLFAEAVSLCALACVAGVVLAYWLIRFLLVYGPQTLPRIDQVSLQPTAVVAACIAGVIVIVVCGTMPALFAATTGLSMAFATRDQSSLPRSRVQDVLVVCQIGGTLALLIAAVLFARSFIRAQGEDPGYPAEHLLIVRLDLPREPYPDRSAVSGFFQHARERLGRLPGVVAVGGITDFFIRRNADQWVTINRRPAGRQEGSPRLAIEGVTPGFFRAAGIEIVAGRDFEERDYLPDAPGVIIVNESLARRFWPDEHAVGQQVTPGDTPPNDGRWRTIVGVCRDMRREALDVAPILGAFIPAYPRGMDLTVRTATRADHLIPAIRREIRSIDESLPVPRVLSAGGRLSERLDSRRFESQVLAAFSATALLLSAAGLYALLAYQVAVRTREIGIRSALGADRHAILGMFLAKGLRLALLGAFAGVAAAVATAKAVEGLLYETAAMHPGSYTAAVALVLVVATAAAGLPALRAGRVDPIAALRDD